MLPTCLAPRSLLHLEKTQQARQNLDVVQDQSRFGGSQKVRIDKSMIFQIQLSTMLPLSCLRTYFPVRHRTVPSSILVRVYHASLWKTCYPSKSFQVSRGVGCHLELEPHACAV